MSSRVLAERYEILEKIGDGGMAVVYKGRDRLLNRYVAVKILKPEFTKDYKFIESFRRESQAAASLTHPNIVNIYDVGREGNINFIVMELIEGKTLSALIQEKGALKSRDAVNIARQIASALSHAHKNHIIH
ncbi:MAG TPA: protein kinase, partial [Bacillota bacterium]|nr:protein kinase [Bacillota bacterium]